MDKTDYLIIGAGPCGLGAAHKLKEAGVENFHVVEKESKAGGLATSYRDPHGFLWDIGGHVLFSHYPYFDEVMDRALGKEGWYYHERQAWVWHQRDFIPYPFQNNIHRLPTEQAWKCLNDLKAQRVKSKNDIPHFKEWLQHNFGEELCKVFMFPYNEKVWGTDLEKMSHQWISERVSQVEITNLEQSLKDKKDQISWGPNSRFRFPKFGGTGAIWEKVAKDIGQDYFTFQSELKEIDTKNKIATFSHGKIQYKKLLTTMPLKTFTQILPHEESHLQIPAASLTHSKTHILGLGFKGKLPHGLKNKCWIYFAEKDFPFYRLTVFSHYSPDHVPKGGEYFSLMLEICETQRNPQPSPEILIDRSLEVLKSQGILPIEAELISRWNLTATHGYPVPTNERDTLLREIMPKLEMKDIFSRGRFGGWKYEVSNQDHTFMQGVEWAESQIHQVPEKTFKV